MFDVGLLVSRGGPRERVALAQGANPRRDRVRALAHSRGGPPTVPLHPRRRSAGVPRPLRARRGGESRERAFAGRHGPSGRRVGARFGGNHLDGRAATCEAGESATPPLRRDRRVSGRTLRVDGPLRGRWRPGPERAVGLLRGQRGIRDSAARFLSCRVPGVRTGLPRCPRRRRRCGQRGVGRRSRASLVSRHERVAFSRGPRRAHRRTHGGRNPCPVGRFSGSNPSPVDGGAGGQGKEGRPRCPLRAPCPVACFSRRWRPRECRSSRRTPRATTFASRTRAWPTPRIPPDSRLRRAAAAARPTVARRYARRAP